LSKRAFSESKVSSTKKWTVYWHFKNFTVNYVSLNCLNNSSDNKMNFNWSDICVCFKYTAKNKSCFSKNIIFGKIPSKRKPSWISFFSRQVKRSTSLTKVKEKEGFWAHYGAAQKMFLKLEVVTIVVKIIISLFFSRFSLNP